MAYKIATEEQAALAQAKFIRMSPYKVRQVVDMIRGRHVDDARRVLAFSERAAAKPVLKVLNSAIANAENNRGLPGDELIVSRAWVDEGPTLKRFRPRALGRATRVRKRTSHISVVVGRHEEVIAQLATDVEDKPKRKRTASKKTTAKKTTAKSTETKKSTAKKTTAKKTTAKKTTAKKSESTNDGGEE